MSLEKAYKLQTEVEANPTLIGYRAMLSEEMGYIAAQRDAILKARQRKQEAIEQRKKKQQELDRLKAERVARTLTPAEYADYCHKWCELLKEYVKRKEVLTFLLSYSTADYRTADLAAVAHWLDTWGTFLSEAEANVRELKLIERSVAKGTQLLSTQILYEALDTVCRLQLQARSLVGRERYRRASLGDEAVEDFIDSQAQLMTWCRKQRETLEELTAMEDLSAFSESFHKNVPVMDSNFLVIVDQSEPLTDNTKVQDALQEVNEEWVQLCLMNYEKLQDTLREVHASSKLEPLCAAWMNGAEGKARDFLAAAQSFLASPSAGQNTTVEGLRKECEDLFKHHEAFGIIATHLSDYSIRDDCVRPHVDSLKNELTTPITSTVLSCPVYEDYEGRQEYKNRLEELREWVDVKSQKGTYIRLMDRLDDTKRMIEEYADALFPDEEEVPGAKREEEEEEVTELDISPREEQMILGEVNMDDSSSDEGKAELGSEDDSAREL